MPADFEQRHRRAEDEFETGQITLETYLDRTVFFRERPFARDQFKDFIFAQSREKTETRVLLDELTATRRYFLAALNNESEELNAYRIRKFDLTPELCCLLYFLLPARAQARSAHLSACAGNHAARSPGVHLHR